MVGARKGPHRSLGFAFGYWFQTTALPTPAILLFAEIEHRHLGRRSQSERLVFSQPHSMRQTRSNSAISRSRIALGWAQSAPASEALWACQVHDGRKVPGPDIVLPLSLATWRACATM